MDRKNLAAMFKVARLCWSVQVPFGSRWEMIGLITITARYNYKDTLLSDGAD